MKEIIEPHRVEIADLRGKLAEALKIIEECCVAPLQQHGVHRDHPVAQRWRLLSYRRWNGSDEETQRRRRLRVAIAARVSPSANVDTGDRVRVAPSKVHPPELAAVEGATQSADDVSQTEPPLQSSVVAHCCKQAPARHRYGAQSFVVPSAVVSVAGPVHAAVFVVQVPTVPIALQVARGPSQAALQQTPDAQNPDLHSVAPAHELPSSSVRSRA